MGDFRTGNIVVDSGYELVLGVDTWSVEPNHTKTATDSSPVSTP